MNTKAIYVKRAADIPAVEHWAIIEDVSVHIPSDERSRTAPGHGYPASTEQYFNYVAFLDEEVFKAELQSRWSQKFGNPVRGIHVSGTYKIATQAVVERQGK